LEKCNCATEITVLKLVIKVSKSISNIFRKHKSDGLLGFIVFKKGNRPEKSDSNPCVEISYKGVQKYATLFFENKNLRASLLYLKRVVTRKKIKLCLGNHCL